MFWFEISSNIGASLIGVTAKLNTWDVDSWVSVADTETIILPLKSKSGVIVSKFPSKDNELFPSTSAPKYTSSPSTSAAIKAIVIKLSSATIWLSIVTKVGASFTAFTLNINEDKSVSNPSVTDTSISMFPLKSKSGDIVSKLPFTEAVALPSTKTEKTKSSWSTSLAINSWIKSVSSFVSEEIKSSNTGASLTAFTVRIKLVETEYSPSDAVTVISSIPL